MLVYGHILDVSTVQEARSAIITMTAGSERPTGWLGFYNERGENVSAIGSHSEYQTVLHCSWKWRCQPMPARPPRWPKAWTLCGYTWLCEWVSERVDVADTFAYSSQHRQMVIAGHHSAVSQALGTFDILELRMLGTYDGWFAVVRYWGFATRIGDNLFKIF